MKLIRYKKTKTSVMGVMKDDVGGTYFTLENASTLIPEGEYRVQVTHSPRFNRPLPLLFNTKVQASRGIRIHEGNKWGDSQGCVLIGNVANLNNCTISDSAKAVEQLLRMCGKDLQIRDAWINNK